jgi:hypothetical protein
LSQHSFDGAFNTPKLTKEYKWNNRLGNAMIKRMKHPTSGTIYMDSPLSIGTLTVTGSLTFGDASMDTLVLKGRMSTGTAAGSAIDIDATYTYGELFELRSDISSWSGCGDSFNGMYFRTSASLGNASGEIHSMYVYGVSNITSGTDGLSLINPLYVEMLVKAGTGSKTFTTCKAIEANISIENPTSGTLTFTNNVYALEAKVQTGSGIADYTKFCGIKIGGRNDGAVKVYGNALDIADPEATVCTWTNGVSISTACATGINVSGATTTGLNITGNSTDAIKIQTGTFTDAIEIAGTTTNGINIGATSGYGIGIGATATGIQVTGATTTAITITGACGTALNIAETGTAATGKAIKSYLSLANGVYSDGFSANEFDLTLTGTCTGHVAASGSWVNIISGTTGANLVCAQTNGVYEESGGTLTGTTVIFGMRMQSLLAEAPSESFPFSCVSNTNVITALFSCNAGISDMGTTSNAGSDTSKLVPLYKETSTGTTYYVKLYSLSG